MQHGRLKKRRIAVLVADGFEKVELAIPVAALRLAGATVDIISLRRGRIRGVNLHEPASRVHVDRTVNEADPREYDALLIPGGFINPDLLRQSAQARAFVQWFDQKRKPIASLCHGPWLLASAGCLEGRTLTSWPGIRDDMVNAGNMAGSGSGSGRQSRHEPRPTGFASFRASHEGPFQPVIPHLGKEAGTAPERPPAQPTAENDALGHEVDAASVHPHCDRLGCRRDRLSRGDAEVPIWLIPVEYPSVEIEGPWLNRAGQVNRPTGLHRVGTCGMAALPPIIRR